MDDLDSLAIKAQYLLHTTEEAEKAAKRTTEHKLMIAVQALQKIAYPQSNVSTAKSKMIALAEQVATTPMAMRGIAIEALERIGISVWD